MPTLEESRQQLQQRAQSIAQAQQDINSFNPRVFLTQQQLRQQTPLSAVRVQQLEQQRGEALNTARSQISQAQVEQGQFESQLAQAQAQFDAQQQAQAQEQSRIDLISSVLSHNARRGNVGSDFARLSREDRALVTNIIREGEDAVERAAIRGAEAQVERQIGGALNPEQRSQVDSEAIRQLAILNNQRIAGIAPSLPGPQRIETLTDISQQLNVPTQLDFFDTTPQSSANSLLRVNPIDAALGRGITTLYGGIRDILQVNPNIPVFPFQTRGTSSTIPTTVLFSNPDSQFAFSSLPPRQPDFALQNIFFRNIGEGLGYAIQSSQGLGSLVRTEVPQALNFINDAPRLFGTPFLPQGSRLVNEGIGIVGGAGVSAIPYIVAPEIFGARDVNQGVRTGNIPQAVIGGALAAGGFGAGAGSYGRLFQAATNVGIPAYIGASALESAGQIRSTINQLDSQINDLNVRLKDPTITSDESITIRDRLRDLRDASTLYKNQLSETKDIAIASALGAGLGAGLYANEFVGGVGRIREAGRIGLPQADIAKLRSLNPESPEYFKARAEALQKIIDRKGNLFANKETITPFQKEFPSTPTQDYVRTIRIPQLLNAAEAARRGVRTESAEAAIGAGVNSGDRLFFEGLTDQQGGKFIAGAIEPNSITEALVGGGKTQTGLTDTKLGINPEVSPFKRLSTSFSNAKGSTEIIASFKGSVNYPKGTSIDTIKFSPEKDIALIDSYSPARKSTRLIPVKGGGKLKLEINDVITKKSTKLGIPSEPIIREIGLDAFGNRIVERSYTVEIKGTRNQKAERILGSEFLKRTGQPFDSTGLKESAKNLPTLSKSAIKEFFVEQPSGNFVRLEVEPFGKGGKAFSGKVGSEVPFNRYLSSTSRSEIGVIPPESVPKLEFPKVPKGKIALYDFSTGEVKLTNAKPIITSVGTQLEVSALDLQKPTITSPVRTTPNELAAKDFESKARALERESKRVNELPMYVGGGGRGVSLFMGGRTQDTSTLTFPVNNQLSRISSPALSFQPLSEVQQTPTIEVESPFQIQSPDYVQRFNSPSGEISGSPSIQGFNQVQQPKQIEQLQQVKQLQEPQISPQVMSPSTTPFPSPSKINRTGSPKLIVRGASLREILGKRKKEVRVIPLIRRRGKFLPIAGPVPVDVGLRKGIAATRGGIARTFQLKPTGGATVEDISLPFRPSVDIFRAPIGKKAQPLTFVEKRPFALKGSPGAVRDIIASRRSKSRGFKFI